MKNRSFEIRDDENGILWLCKGAKEERQEGLCQELLIGQNKVIEWRGLKQAFEWSLLPGGGGNRPGEQAVHSRSHVHIDLREHAVAVNKVNDGSHVSQLCIL